MALFVFILFLQIVSLLRFFVQYFIKFTRLLSAAVNINELILALAKISLKVLMSSAKGKVGKIPKGEKLVGTLQTTLFQIFFFKSVLHSKVIVKSIIDPDDNFFDSDFPLTCFYLTI